jgi:hypothetical protein
MCRLDQALSVLAGHARQVSSDVEVKPVSAIGSLADTHFD